MAVEFLSLSFQKKDRNYSTLGPWRDKTIIGVPIYMHLNSTNLGYCLYYVIGNRFCEDVHEQNQTEDVNLFLLLLYF